MISDLGQKKSLARLARVFNSEKSFGILTSLYEDSIGKVFLESFY